MHEFHIITKKFSLRPFRVTDATAIRKNIQHKQIFENTLTIPRPYLLKHAKEHIAKNLRQYRMSKPSNIGFVVEVDGEAAGAIGMTFRGTTGEIGYWLAKKHWGQGMMSEIIGLMTDYVFQTYHLRSITARVFVHNLASARVLEKNNFRRVRKIIKGEQKDGKWISIVEYKKNPPKKV